MSKDETVTVALKKPVEHAGVIYSELTFREAEIGDMLVADNFDGEFAKNIAVLASISGVPMPAFKKIKVSDMKVIMVKVADLLGNEPAKPMTGEASLV